MESAADYQARVQSYIRTQLNTYAGLNASNGGIGINGLSSERLDHLATSLGGIYIQSMQPGNTPTTQSTTISQTVITQVQTQMAGLLGFRPSGNGTTMTPIPGFTPPPWAQYINRAEVNTLLQASVVPLISRLGIQSGPAGQLALTNMQNPQQVVTAISDSLHTELLRGGDPLRVLSPQLRQQINQLPDGVRTSLINGPPPITRLVANLAAAQVVYGDSTDPQAVAALSAARAALVTPAQRSIQSFAYTQISQQTSSLLLGVVNDTQNRALSGWGRHVPSGVAEFVGARPSQTQIDAIGSSVGRAMSELVSQGASSTIFNNPPIRICASPLPSRP